MELNNIISDVIKEVEEKIKEMKHVNIIVMGKTGVGKSTLINATFRENLAETGIGAPVSDRIALLEKKDFPLRVHDTVGLELSYENQEKVSKDISKLIKDSFNSKDGDKRIHLIWYCVNVDSNRLEPKEEEFIKKLSSDNKSFNIPIVLVLTLSHNLRKSKEMKEYVLSRQLPVKEVFTVLAQDYEDVDFIRKSYGLKELVEFCAEILPELARDAFINTQKTSLLLKKKNARKIIKATTLTTFAEGFVPLPFSDATLLVPTQISMIASITAIYGVSMDKAMMSAIASSLLGTTGATIAGRSLVGNIFKFIPGVGSVVGGSITGSTAALLTTALGETYIAVMEMLLKGEISSNQLASSAFSKQIRNIFKENIKLFNKKK